MVLLDLSAAFDTIDHDIMLERLRDRFGINGTAWKWFQSYLKQRTQSVCINGCHSEKKCLVCCVPQGSVLGPLLYVLYTYGLGDILRLDFHLYADDTQLYITFCPRTNGDIELSTLKLQTCIKAVRNWMTTNFLKLNEEKTEFMYFASPYYSKRLSEPSLQVGNDLVNCSSSVRNLGAFFDRTMSMVEHVTKTTKAAYFQLRKIRYIRKYLSKSNTEKLVHAFISSRLDLNNALLYGITSTQTKILQKIQNSAARLITGVHIRVEMTPVLRSLHWLPIEKRKVFKICLLVYKCLNGMAPTYLSDIILPLRIDGGLRSTTNSLLKVHITRTNFGERAFSISGPFLWNRLPTSVRQSGSLGSFKTNLKTILFNS